MVHRVAEGVKVEKRAFSKPWVHSRCQRSQKVGEREAAATYPSLDLDAMTASMLLVVSAILKRVKVDLMSQRE